MQYVCSPVVVIDYTVCNRDKLTFCAGVRSFPLLPHADNLKENVGYSVLFHVGVASAFRVQGSKCLQKGSVDRQKDIHF